MPLFGRKSKSEPTPPKPPPPISIDLPPGEEVERGTAAELLQGKQSIKGTLFMTNRRLLFEAKKGDARWMVVPFDEVRATGLFPAPGMTMGMPSSRRQCLFVETTKGEQVWWDFAEKEEREWLPLVQQHLAAAQPSDEND
jgi:hypothetical protein